MDEGSDGGGGGTIEGDDASDERHLFGEERSTAVGLVASEIGILRVELAPDRVGGFGLVEPCTATDIATNGNAVVVGTDEDALADLDGDGEFTGLGFGPVAAVGIDDRSVFAAAQDGTVSRMSVDQTDGTATKWEVLGEISGPRRFDGNLIATATGVVRIEKDLEMLGLRDVNDVARGDVGNNADDQMLFAATDDGLYRFDGDWTCEFKTPIQRVSFEGGDGFAVTDDGRLFRREPATWEEISLPDGKAALDVGARESLYVITADGELLIGAESGATSDGFEGWRTQPLGVRDVTGFVLLDG